ncbi:DUF4126 domain-containing protein [Croceiramulus getboli]|nr:DUF4126 domain-containing protein [Flavobacteriaceae bacterium YJPT1-3]
MELFISICLGLGLAASAGFRVFVPLFVLSLCAYVGVFPLQEDWTWVGSLPAVLILGSATVVEILAYYIPWVDNALDTIAVPLAAIAGTLMMIATLTGMDPVISWSLAIIAGGGTAAAIAGTTGGTRLASSVSTGGIANPVVSTVEAGTATVLSLLSVFLPIVAFILVLVIIWIVFRSYRKLSRKRKQKTSS